MGVAQARRGLRPAALVPHGAALPVVGAITLGVAGALQAYVNGRLGRSLGSGELAAMVNNVVGLGILATLVITTGAVPRAHRRRDGVRAWHLLGGLGGAMVVTAGAIGAPEIGVALLTVALVCGQTGGSLLGDAAGLSPAGRHAASPPRLAGAALAIAAVLLPAFGGGSHLHLGLLAFAVAAGVGTALQQAANGQLARATGEPIYAGTVNFVVGLTALVIVAAIATGLSAPDGWSAPPLEFTGGVLGALIATGLAVLVSRLGILRLMLALTAGQMAGALAIDLIAPARGEPVTLATAAGVGLAFVAVLVVSGRRRPREPAARL